MYGIVNKAIEYKLGARGLRSICETVMNDIMFELPDKKEVKRFEITSLLVEEKLNKSKFRHLKVA